MNSENVTYYLLSFTKTRKGKARKLRKKVNIRHNNQNLDDLTSTLNTILRNSRTIKRSGKLKAPMKILKLLDDLIPNEYFGTQTHRKLFYQIVKRILTQSTHECIYRSLITRGYNYRLIPWLVQFRDDKDECESLLLKANLFLLESVVKPLIAYFYKPVKTYEGHEVQFIRKDKWASFESRVFHKLKRLKYIVECDQSEHHRSRGILKIVPKGAIEEIKFRPIVSIYQNSDKYIYKKITSKLYLAARDMYKHVLPEVLPSLYDSWKIYTKTVENEDIYGVKLDIRDAYGNINIHHLTIIITSLQEKYLLKTEKQFVLNHIQNQFVTFRGKDYKWTHGLLQGDRLSSCLCELYMAFFDKLYLPEFPPKCFIHRTVDDYFFCSTDWYQVTRFINNIKTTYELNENKTKMNILKKHDEIPYCGKVFNLKTKEVKKLYAFRTGFEIRHKFKLWNYSRPIAERKGRLFLTKAMTFSYNNNCFTKMEMNTVFNSQKTVLENFFDGMVYVAYKFDAAVMAIRPVFPDDTSFVLEVLEQSVHAFAFSVLKKIESCKGQFYRHVITCQLLRTLAYKAFILVLKRRNEVYKEVLATIKNRDVDDGKQYESNFKIKFDSNLDYSYFNKIPKNLQHLKINRHVSV